MKICLLCAELSPFAKTGGLGDAVAGLARFLHEKRELGVELRVFLPDYASGKVDRDRVVPVDYLQGLSTVMGGRRFSYDVHTTNLPDTDLPVYLIDCPELYGRAGIYDDRGDEHQRFALLSRAAIESCQGMGFGPDVFHCHDWHAGLTPLYLRTEYAWDRLFSSSATLVTIHNIAYQGTFPARAVAEVGLARSAGALHQEDLAHGRFSFLTTAILYADWLSTVSRSHAWEIQTPELGFGLDALLRERSDHLSGIVNGVDYSEWDPRTDEVIEARYSPEDLSGKETNRRRLLEKLRLDWDPHAPVLSVVSRLVAQKGLDVLVSPLQDALGHRNVRVVVLGSGEPELEQVFQALDQRFPGRMRFYRGFDNDLAHEIYAGSDVFLMPSRYEPCGLSQLYSLRYGTPPLVHRTGGLADTVELYDSAHGTGTGFVFDHLDDRAVRWALGYALDSYADREGWQRLMRNGMAKDFSWAVQGERYLELYRSLAR